MTQILDADFYVHECKREIEMRGKGGEAEGTGATQAEARRGVLLGDAWRLTMEAEAVGRTEELPGQHPRDPSAAAAADHRPCRVGADPYPGDHSSPSLEEVPPAVEVGQVLAEGSPCQEVLLRAGAYLEVEEEGLHAAAVVAAAARDSSEGGPWDRPHLLGDQVELGSSKKEALAGSAGRQAAEAVEGPEGAQGRWSSAVRLIEAAGLQQQVVVARVEGAQRRGLLTLEAGAACWGQSCWMMASEDGGRESC